MEIVPTKCKSPSGLFSKSHLLNFFPDAGALDLDVILFCLNYSFKNLFIEYKHGKVIYDFKQKQELRIIHAQSFLKSLIEGYDLINKINYKITCEYFKFAIIIQYMPISKDEFEVHVKCIEGSNLMRVIQAIHLEHRLITNDTKIKLIKI